MRLTLTQQVDEWVVIGESMLVAPTDIDAAGVRLVARGVMIGGPDDGARFLRTVELAIGSSFELGPMVTVTLVDVRGEKARLAFILPAHVSVHRKEILLKINPDWKEPGATR